MTVPHGELKVKVVSHAVSLTSIEGSLLSSVSLANDCLVKRSMIR